MSEDVIKIHNKDKLPWEQACLRALCLALKADDTPRTRDFHVPHVDVLVPIGDDYTATLTMTKEAYDVLMGEE